MSTIIHENEERPAPWECKEYTESLLQATSINKRALNEDIERLSVKGIANYSDAINFAYETFKKVSFTLKGPYSMIVIEAARFRGEGGGGA